MTATDLITIIAALGGLVTIIGGVIVNIVVAMRKEVAEVNAKADVIAGHVNSAASASLAKIEGLQTEIANQRREMAEKKETAALLAQSVLHIEKSTSAIEKTVNGPTEKEGL